PSAARRAAPSATAPRASAARPRPTPESTKPRGQSRALDRQGWSVVAFGLTSDGVVAPSPRPLREAPRGRYAGVGRKDPSNKGPARGRRSYGATKRAREGLVTVAAPARRGRSW